MVGGEIHAALSELAVCRVSTAHPRACEALVRAALERLVVGTDRGLSEALVDLALLVWPIHWTRLREARF